MNDNAIVGLLLAGCGIVLAFAGVQMARGRIARNPLIGYRTRRTLGDEQIWYPVNAMSGIWMVWAGALSAVIGLLLLIFSGNESAQRLVLGIGVPALVICLILGIYRGWRLASAIDAELHRREMEQLDEQPNDPAH